MKTLYIAASLAFFSSLLGGCGAGTLPNAGSAALRSTHRQYVTPASCPGDSGGIMTGDHC